MKARHRIVAAGSEPGRFEASSEGLSGGAEPTEELLRITLLGADTWAGFTRPGYPRAPSLRDVCEPRGA